MLKAALLALSAIAVASSAVIPADDETSSTGCKFTNQMWGSVDMTRFYVCLMPDEIALEFACPENSFFQSTAESSGCMPATMIDGNCAFSAAAEPVCSGANLKQPQPHADPTKFYLCTSEGATPVELACEDGTAFVSQDGYLGCFTWVRFREIRQCFNY